MLNGLKWRLRKQNKEVFGDIQRRKESLVNEIKTVHDLLEVAQYVDLLAKEEQLLKSFDIILEQEETLWFQKFR